MSSEVGLYKLHAGGKRRPYVITDGSDDDGYLTKFFVGEPLPLDWNPPSLTVHRASGGLSDAINWQSRPPLLSEKAVSIFSNAFPGLMEYRFVLEMKGRPYLVANVLSVVDVDVIDESESGVRRLSDGRIEVVDRYVINSEKIKSLPPIFRLKLPAYVDSTILVLDEVPQVVVREKLTGFSFWDANNPREMKDLFNGLEMNVYPGVLS